MGSFNQTTLNYQVQNSNSLTVMIGDVVVGFGQTVGSTIDWGTEQLYGIGSANPQDIQQLKIAPSINVDEFMLTAAGLAFLGYPNTMVEVIGNNQFDITLVSNTNAPILTYVGCVASNFSLQIPANQVVTQTINFLAIDVLGPTGQSVLIGQNAQQVAALAGAVANTFL